MSDQGKIQALEPSAPLLNREIIAEAEFSQADIGRVIDILAHNAVIGSENLIIFLYVRRLHAVYHYITAVTSICSGLRDSVIVHD